MKKLLILFLLLTASASSQFAMVGAWQSADSFAPDDIDSLKLYLVAQDVIDSLGEASGDTIYRWRNRVNPSIPAIQTTAAKKPIVQADSLNGHAVVVFDGVDDVMLATQYFASSSDYSVFLVAKLAKPVTVQAIVENYSNPVEWKNNGFILAVVDNDSSVVTGAGFMTQRNNVRHVGIAAFVASIRDTTSGLGSLKINSGGATYSTAVGNGDAFVYGANISIAARGATSTIPAAVSIAEILVYTKKLNDEEETNVLSYLATKYEITLTP